MTMKRLPKDIPAREELIKAGFTNYAVLRNHGPIETIRGISRKKADQIRDYISGNKNEEAPESEYPVHKGGGYYLLSNGEQVRGKDEAIEAQNQLE